MSKDIYIMPIHISSLVIDPKGFFNQHAPAGAGWVTHHIVNMDNGDKHIVTSNCFATIKNLLWSTDGNTFHNAIDQKMKDQDITSLRKLELLT
jgi:hypothetical protein